MERAKAADSGVHQKHNNKHIQRKNTPSLTKTSCVLLLMSSSCPNAPNPCRTDLKRTPPETPAATCVPTKHPLLVIEPRNISKNEARCATVSRNSTYHNDRGCREVQRWPEGRRPHRDPHELARGDPSEMVGAQAFPRSAFFFVANLQHKRRGERFLRCRGRQHRVDKCLENVKGKCGEAFVEKLLNITAHPFTWRWF